MLRSKNRLHHASSRKFIAAVVACSLCGGLVGGLIPCTVLATKKSLKK
jgi:hypothetical protein